MIMIALSIIIKRNSYEFHELVQSLVEKFLSDTIFIYTQIRNPLDKKHLGNDLFPNRNEKQAAIKHIDLQTSYTNISSSIIALPDIFQVCV